MWPVGIGTQILGSQSMAPRVSWLVMVWVLPMYPKFAFKENSAAQRSRRLRKVVHLLCWEFAANIPRRRHGCGSFIGCRVPSRRLPCWAVLGRDRERARWPSFLKLNLINEGINSSRAHRRQQIVFFSLKVVYEHRGRRRKAQPRKAAIIWMPSLRCSLLVSAHPHTFQTYNFLWEPFSLKNSIFVVSSVVA